MILKPVIRPLLRPVVLTPALAILLGVGASANARMAAVFRQAGLTFYSPGTLQNKVFLRKLRTDYPEFAVYTPLSRDGVKWHRWWFTNRQNTGNSGCPRMVRCSLAYLYSSTTTAAAAENLTTGTEGQAPTSTQATTDGSATGTWTAPATIGGVTGISYSTNPGDKRTYTVTVAEGGAIAWRTHRNATATANRGGIAKLTVKTSPGGVEIDAGNYTIPSSSGERLVDLSLTTGTGAFYIAVASDLPAGTYTVDVEVDDTNANRVYDGGMRVYAARAFNATGRHRSWLSLTANSTTTPTTLDAGATTVYAFTGTRVDWKYIRTTVAGIANFKVYDSNGDEIGSYDATTQDTYGTNANTQVTVASGLPQGTYYLHVTAANTKNASSTAYRLYDRGIIAYNEEVGGDPDTDEFDDQGLTGVAVEGAVTLIGTGNLELAVSAVKPEEAPSGQFAGGTHGNESAPASLVYTMDGAVIDFAGGAAGATWSGSEFNLSFTTQLLHVSDASAFADVTYDYTLNRRGYTPVVTRELLSDVKMVEDYVLMHMAPSTDTGTQGIAGGFEKFSCEGDTEAFRTYNAHDNSNNALPNQTAVGVFFNDSYAVTAQIHNLAEINEHYADESYAGSRPLSFVQDRTDNNNKWYDRVFSGSSDGVIVPAGDTITTRKTYRALELA